MDLEKKKKATKPWKKCLKKLGNQSQFLEGFSMGHLAFKLRQMFQES